MASIKYIGILCLLVFVGGCKSDDDASEPAITTLADLIALNEIEIDNVIACASGSEKENEIIAYFYPRPGATALRYFETSNAEVDKNEYANYTFVDLPVEDLFNGYLKKITIQSAVEKWVIISFRESGKIHLSNPIRLKHKTQNTLFGEAISINQDTSGKPNFDWAPIVSNNDAIYFQVVSDASSKLISGTYTFESQFQFYNLENVVLNITDGTPPDLILKDPYRFTLMSVSEDNWVNYLALEIPFIAQ